tara:strand:- start:107 stop:982 length:876 start_codon:yes stop_codon:yes gene_type:complete
MKNVSLVVSCGGARGVSAIGVIEELEKRGYKISSVSGTSIGSAVLGIYSLGNLNKYKDWLCSLSRIDVFRQMDFTISKHGLIKGEKVFNAMKEFLPDEKIENLKIPYSAIAADVNTFQEIIFKKGSLHHAIRCSTSIPSIMMPVVSENQVLVDGGVVNPLPLSRVKRKKGDILVAVDLNHHYYEQNVLSKKTDHYSLDFPIIGNMMKYFGRSTKKKNIDNVVGFLNKTIYIMIHQLSQNAIDIYKPDVLIKIPSKTCGIFDFHKSKELIEIGRGKAIEQLNLYENKIKKAP